ncbi:Mce-associated membrane protein [Thermomonospora echinospora]|uniref:Mce-associated membrane protein n=1 Tax=Thermomonospora echinospora TaxID=1992 RepID=A0A1H5Y0S7_9ACTN|nr:hypothetical protein [Thermomonospora echinospora]SEG17561.1 Mce-associated membrane protein [Thermomonospora echinospora]
MEKDTVSADGNPHNGLPATVVSAPRPNDDDPPADGTATNGRTETDGHSPSEAASRADDELPPGADGGAPSGAGAAGQAEASRDATAGGGEKAKANDGPSGEAEGTEGAGRSGGSDVGTAGEDTAATDGGPASEGDDTASPGDKTGEAGKTGGGSRSRAAWLRDPLVLALVFVVVGAALLVRAAQVRGDEAAENRALTDVERTEVVIGDVSNALGKVFSYSYANTAVTEQAARDVLAGRAFNQYQTLFGQVKQQAAAQRLTLTSRVVRAGVVRMSGDTAQLLVFLDQTVHRKDKPGGTTAAAQLSVTARLSDGHWRIVDIQAR